MPQGQAESWGIVLARSIQTKLSHVDAVAGNAVFPSLNQWAKVIQGSPAGLAMKTLSNTALDNSVAPPRAAGMKAVGALPGVPSDSVNVRQFGLNAPRKHYTPTLRLALWHAWRAQGCADSRPSHC